MKHTGSQVHNWIGLGDKFILGYLLTNSVSTVSIFCIAHAMEAYLKACILKQHGLKKAMKDGHKLYKMFSCLKIDPNFLPGINIPQHCFDNYTIEFTDERDNTPECLKLQHYLFPFKYCADIKYLGAALMQVSGSYGYGFTYPEFRYTRFFHGIRSYLSWKTEGPHHDSLLQATKTIFKDESVERTFLQGCMYGVLDPCNWETFSKRV